MRKIHINSGLRVVVGLGITGLSCLRYLIRKGYSVAVTDSRESPPCLAEARCEFPDLKIAAGEFSAELINQAEEIIVSPGVALTHPLFQAAKARGVPIVGDIELFARATKAPIVAITGSNGKSTVTTLVGLMAKEAGLKVHVGGNLGTPVLDFLNEPEADCTVLELSSFQLDTTYSLRAASAVVLNVTPDHMDRYENFEAYLASKQRVYRHCKTAVLNVDDPTLWNKLNFSEAPWGFSIHPEALLPIIFKDSQKVFRLIKEEEQFYLAQAQKKLLAVNEMKLKGRHNEQNALAALALGAAMNFPMEAMLQVLKTFPGLPHRTQWVAHINGVDWYNDSKGTNVGATQAAILGLGEILKAKKIILIAGGQAKNADLRLLNSELEHYVKQVIILGEDAPLLEASWEKVVPIERVNTLQDAVMKASVEARSGELVLLSPACASLDMFKNYEDRGDQFMEAVLNLKKENG